MRWTAALSALALLAGCRTVVWYGRDETRRLTLEVEAVRGGQRVAVDGRAGPTFDGVAPEGLWLAAGGRLVYPARRGARWFLVDGARVGPAFDAIGEVAVAPDGAALAYAAALDGRWLVVRDGRAGTSHDAVRAGSLTWDGGGRHLAYVAVDGEADRVVVDGAAGAPFDGVAGLTLAAGRVAFLARRGAQPLVVVDGVERPVQAAAWLAVDQRGRVAWAERRGDGWRVVVDGEGVAEAEGVEGLALADGRWGALLRRAGRTEVVVDGVVLAREEEASDLRLAGRHAAWVNVRAGARAVVLDGSPRRLDVIVEGSLALDAAGRWAVVAADAVTRRIEVLVDGLPVERFDLAEAGLRGAPGEPPSEAALEAWARRLAAGALARPGAAPPP